MSTWSGAAARAATAPQATPASARRDLRKSISANANSPRPALPRPQLTTARAGGAACRRSKVRGFRLGGGMIMLRQRLDRIGVGASFVLSSVEEENAVARSLQHLLRAKPTVVLIASTTAPAGPDDVVGRAMVRAGCHIERFLAPVEPGNLFLLGYKDDVPIVSAPGCFRSAKPNVVDLMLPPMLARYRVSGWEVACLGHGGLLA